jgi:hypothetical protein
LNSNSQFAVTGDAELLAATEERVLRLLGHREAAAAAAARRDIWETEVRCPGNPEA